MNVQSIRYSFIVARSRNKVIGCENRLPWRLPSDLRTFKRLTIGKPVIMGRKTFESIGRPLPGRPNIVLSREHDITSPDVFVAKDKVAAKVLAEREARRLGATEIMVIGGEQVFTMFADEVSRVYLTEVHAEVSGDSFFSLDLSRWHAELTEEHQRGISGDEYSYTFSVLAKPKRPACSPKVSSSSGRLLAPA